jgi:hypothetical protein
MFSCEMEGKFAVKTLNLRARVPILCGISFCVGITLEFIMCRSGFYNIYDVKQGLQQAEKHRESDEFWIRVEARRQAKAHSGVIKD